VRHLTNCVLWEWWKNIFRTVSHIYLQILRSTNRPFFGRYPYRILCLSGFYPFIELLSQSEKKSRCNISYHITLTLLFQYLDCQFPVDKLFKFLAFYQFLCSNVENKGTIRSYLPPSISAHCSTCRKSLHLLDKISSVPISLLILTIHIYCCSRMFRPQSPFCN